MFLEKGRTRAEIGGVLRNTSNAQVVAASVELALTRAERRRGLLGRDGLEPGHAMLIAPCSSIHTWFMRFPIDVIFVARDGRVVKTRAAIPPWRLALAPGAYAVVELPAGAIAEALVRIGDRLELADSIS
ncbi:MAG TPA: DUF192 domain-containing protein [Vicinamibacterales bacterium]|jgi:hypothetical protein|nr:DUF192 domain-containing protein [Vicinamibacterales bacterium]